MKEGIFKEYMWISGRIRVLEFWDEFGLEIKRDLGCASQYIVRYEW